MSGDRGSVAGIELLTRSSLNSLKDTNDIDASSFLWEAQPMDDRNWSCSYLRYQQALHRGYFTVFLIVQSLLSLAHVIIILFCTQSTEAEKYVPDMFGYLAAAVLSWPLLVIVYKWKNPSLASVLALLLVIIPDLCLPIYHTYADHTRYTMRPAFTTHTILAVYVFLPLVHNSQALLLGIGVTLCHLSVLFTVTYSRSAHIYKMIIADFIYLVCVNGLGLYFRFVNEVVVRRTFLDRRACVESTLRLHFEKEQEEQLMLSILPKHIAARVKKDIRNVFQHIKLYQNEPLKKKPFSELYVEQHDMVSILYADVVNYSQLTVSLPPNKLVETLNELFGRFDEVSEERNVLRIKFLGDCYYCVSGVPNPNPHHAQACVDLALDMIKIIQDVRKTRGLDIDMRIGVHSGKIFSGILGVCKWQYDIWSQDVVIANHMEQTGRPGMVHVTQQTLKLLGNDYDWEPNCGNKSPLLDKLNIKTFLIKPRKQCRDVSGNNFPFVINRRDSSPPRSAFDFFKIRTPSPYNSGGTTPVLRRRTMFMDNNLVLYQEMLRTADKAMQTAIEQMPIGNYKTWADVKDVNPICLTFEHWRWEYLFLQLPDPLFKFYVAGGLAVLICMFLIQRFTLSQLDSTFLLCYGFTAILFLIALPFTWTHFIWNMIQDPHQEMDVIPEPKQPFLKVLYRTSILVVWSNCTRTLLYIVFTILLALCSLIVLIEWSRIDAIPMGLPEAYLDKDSLYCLTPWHITETCSLSVLMCFLFLRVHFQLKLLVSCFIVAAHMACVLLVQPRLFQEGDTWNPGLEPQFTHILSVLFLTFTLHLMDRQAEYMNRLDYRWKRQLAVEQEEAATTHIINKMLLQNILPTHVAELYLNVSRPYRELYYEQYDSVSVMFATLVESHDTAPASTLVSLEILNQIICDFDKILFVPKASRVEKIKVAGWTYLAACGLEPSVRSASGEDNTHPLVMMTCFAANMLRVLRKFNAANNHTFKLRIGIAHGAVTAGVVGSQKPLYDIWGDVVNLASRMDSTGLPNEIQVTEKTCDILEDHGVTCELRGRTFIKGKGLITTYFIRQQEIEKFQKINIDSKSYMKIH
ncbi:hypothetical protein M8J76_003724 [Diaphorina citri]|nr:hypothetical protein M8J76_003724 [Diaphorina citri]